MDLNFEKSSKQMKLTKTGPIADLRHQVRFLIHSDSSKSRAGRQAGHQAGRALKTMSEICSTYVCVPRISPIVLRALQAGRPAGRSDAQPAGRLFEIGCTLMKISIYTIMSKLDEY